MSAAAAPSRPARGPGEARSPRQGGRSPRGTGPSSLPEARRGRRSGGAGSDPAARERPRRALRAGEPGNPPVPTHELIHWQSTGLKRPFQSHVLRYRRTAVTSSGAGLCVCAFVRKGRPSCVGPGEPSFGPGSSRARRATRRRARSTRRPTRAGHRGDGDRKPPHRVPARGPSPPGIATQQEPPCGGRLVLPASGPGRRPRKRGAGRGRGRGRHRSPRPRGRRSPRARSCGARDARPGREPLGPAPSGPHPRSWYFASRASMAFTLSAERPSGSNSQARNASAIDFASSVPTTREPIVMIWALLDSAARSAE